MKKAWQAGVLFFNPFSQHSERSPISRVRHACLIYLSAFAGVLGATPR